MNINPAPYLLSLWSTIRERLRNRQDSEHEQAVIRIIIAVMVSSYLYTLLPDNSSSKYLINSFYFINIYLGLSILLLAAIVVQPQKSRTRRITGIISDAICTSILLHLGDAAIAPWFGVYLWVIFGNGFRYGEKYLYLSALLSITGFSLAISFTPFWQQNINMGIGLLVSLFVLPGYVATLIRRIQTERQRAEQANLAKSEFLARMSHEIRTPLNGIIGTGELLETCNLGAEEKEYVATIKDSGKTLIRLVEDILDISRIEAGKMEAESIDFDLYELINTSINIFSPQARSKGLRLSKYIDIRIPFNLNGDPMHLRQVLTNLLGNAVKFTDDGAITLKASLVESNRSNIKIRFEVTDTGIGIHKDTQSKIFEKFTQADETTTRRYGGSGLGMAIAKQLVELMGGRIGVTSTPDAGSSFWFELTLDVQESTDISADRLAISNLKVLRISDNISNQTNATNYLRELNANIWDVDSIRKAMDILNNTHDNYAMVLLDGISQPNALTEQINTLATDPRYADKPVLIIQPDAEEPIQPNEFDQRINLLYEPVDRELFFRALYLYVSNTMNRSGDEVGIETRANGNARQLNILVAEDNPINGMVIGRILDKVGHQHHLVLNGEQLLDSLKCEEYDLAIIDMHMPVLGGIDAYKAYSNNIAKNKLIPFIMLTANATVEAHMECKEAGIEHFLTKPISSIALINTINIATHQEATHTLIDAGYLLNDNQSITEPIDTNTVDQVIRMAPDYNFLVQLHQSMEKYGSLMLDKMSQANKDEDLNEFKEIAHALKGAAISLGMTKLTRLLQQAEHMTSGRFHANGSEYIKNLRIVFDLGTSMIEQEFSRNQSTPKANTDDIRLAQEGSSLMAD